MPAFVRRDPLGKIRARIVRYSDDNPTDLIEEKVVDEAPNLEPDGLYGYGAIEIAVSERLKRSGI